MKLLTTLQQMASVLLANVPSSKSGQSFTHSLFLSLRGPTSAQVTHLFGLVFLIQSQGGHFTKHLGIQPSQFTPKLPPDGRHHATCSLPDVKQSIFVYSV